MTLWLWMSGKRNVSVCIGHELANALYFLVNMARETWNAKVIFAGWLAGWQTGTNAMNLFPVLFQLLRGYCHNRLLFKGSIPRKISKACKIIAELNQFPFFKKLLPYKLTILSISRSFTPIFPLVALTFSQLQTTDVTWIAHTGFYILFYYARFFSPGIPLVKTTSYLSARRSSECISSCKHRDMLLGILNTHIKNICHLTVCCTNCISI